MTGDEVIKLRDQLATQRAPYESHWRELAEVYTPFRGLNDTTPDILTGDSMFDSTPRQSAGIYANGLCSLIIPRNEQWFEFTPPRSIEQDDEARRWYREASETCYQFIEASNFYEEIQEALFESGAFGTCSLYCGELDDMGELHFLNQTIGTYYLIEDAKGRVCGFLRDLCYTAEQAAEEFGVDELPKKIAAMVGKPQGLTEKHNFVHLVTKRRGEKKPDAPEAEMKPWIDIVVAVEGKKVVREGGVNEFTFACHRHAKHRKSVYGFGPGAMAKGDSYQLSFLNELADLATEKEVFPPLVATADLEGEVAQGALEITYRDPNTPGSDVKELHTRGRYDIVKDRIADKQQQVKSAFHVDLFQLFSLRSQERAPLTATEAHMIAGEKLTQFSPVYGRIMNEMVDVILARVFAVLLRARKFSEMPVSVATAMEGGKVRYKNKIALAMQAKENGALLEFFSILLPVMQAFPEMGPLILDSFRAGVVTRDMLRNAGVPERWIATMKEFQAAQDARAKAAQQRAQLENAELASKSVANLGNAPPNMIEMAQRQAG